MELKKTKLETVKNALQIAVMYAKTESYTAEFALLLIEVDSAINSEKEWEKIKKEMSSLDKCPFHYLDKIIFKLPVVYDWVNYKGEDVVASINIERTLKAKKPMMDISYCMTKAFNEIHLKTVIFNKKHFKKSKLSDSDIDW